MPPKEHRRRKVTAAKRARTPSSSADAPRPCDEEDGSPPCSLTDTTTGGPSRSAVCSRALVGALSGPFLPNTPLSSFARLYLAARDGVIASVSAMLAGVARVVTRGRGRNRTDPNDVSALRSAVRRRRLEVVKALLAAGTDPNARLQKLRKKLPLLCTAMQPLSASSLPIVEALIAAGADVNAAAADGDCPLLTAVAANDLVLVKALLAAKADPDGVLSERSAPRIVSSHRAAPWPRFPPLIEAIVRHRDLGVPIVEALLAAGADPNLRDLSHGSTALHVTARYPRISAAVTKALLAAGADVDALTEEEDETALLLATKNGNDDICEALIAAEADVNEGSPIVLAALDGRYEVVRQLLAAGANINASRECGAYGYRLTALTAAISNRHDAVVELLLVSEADPNIGYRNTDLTATNSPLLAAVRRVDYVTALLAAGADVNGAGKPPPLLEANNAGVLATVRVLIAAGADVNVRRDDCGIHCRTTFMETDDPHVAQALMDAGADVSACVSAEQSGASSRYFSWPGQLAKVLVAEGAELS